MSTKWADRYREFRRSLKESFSLKIFRSLAIASMIVFLIFTIFLVAYQRMVVKENLVKEGKMLAGMTAYSSTTGVFAENRDLVKDAVQGIMSQANVLSVTIYTANDKVLLFKGKGPVSSATSPLTEGEKRTSLSPGEKKRSFLVRDDGKTIGVVSPVIMELSSNAEEAAYFDAGGKKRQEVIGYVRVVMDEKALDKEIVVVLLRNALIALFFLLLSAVVIYLSIRRVTRPLTTLTEAVRRLGLGETVEEMPVESMDEIGKLASAFNAMSENLRKREEEKKALEEKLRYAQKMEAVGTLARGIAHDFNNILSTVRGSVYILEKKLFDQSPLRQYITQIQNALNKARNLIGSLVSFSRLQAIYPSTLDLNVLITKLKPMLTSIGGETVEVRLSLWEEGLFITVDRVQIEQVLMNLCTNARDAMPDGGVLTIKTEPVIIDDAASASSPATMPGRYARITVSDTGVGIEEEIREKVFEPFFTTKEVGKGTGLGLAIIYGIIEQYRGFIEMQTEAGKGTAFNVYIPAAEEAAEGDLER